jgi:hypothetical protein
LVGAEAPASVCLASKRRINFEIRKVDYRFLRVVHRL